MTSLITELRRRNVLRVAAAYALVAWIIIEAGSVLLPTFGADESTFQVYVIVVLAGFLVSLVAAWVFEITPEGVKLEKHVDRSATDTGQSSQRFNFAIILLLVGALAISITFNVTGVRGSDATEDSTVVRRSIAVLPFTSLSSDPDNATFVDGMHDDLLTRLAKIGTLKVISRTSVLEYRETSKNLRQIGEELGVETLLEGTVQKVGDNVRINVQLIDAASDDHLWAQTYDRQLSMQNIFSIQSEISTAIAGALQATLLPTVAEQPDSIPTEDIRAYSLYVSGRDDLYLRTLDAIERAAGQFRQAIELDPEYAEAYVALAEAYLLLFINHNALPRDEAYRLARENLDEAMALNPELSDAWATEGLLKTNQWAQTRFGTGNLEAEAAYEYAISLNPNNAQAYMWFASLRDSEQRIEDSIALYHRSMQLDPLARIPYLSLPGLYAQMGQNEVALKLWLDAIEIHPDWPDPYQTIAAHLLGMGRLDEAYAWNRALLALNEEPPADGNIDVAVLMQFGFANRARAIVNELPPQHPLLPFAGAITQYLDGNFEEANDTIAAIMQDGEITQLFVYDVAADIALVAGDYERARDYVLRRSPALTADAALQVNRFTIRHIVRLAAIELRTGNINAANDMLRAALPVAQTLPRLGLFGQGIRDVQILALLGRREAALAALHEAVDRGYRTSAPTDNWLLANDPFLSGIREDPRFTEILRELDKLNGEMRQRLLESEASGDWDSLRALAGSG